MSDQKPIEDKARTPTTPLIEILKARIAANADQRKYTEKPLIDVIADRIDNNPDYEWEPQHDPNHPDNTHPERYWDFKSMLLQNTVEGLLSSEPFSPNLAGIIKIEPFGKLPREEQVNPEDRWKPNWHIKSISHPSYYINVYPGKKAVAPVATGKPGNPGKPKPAKPCRMVLHPGREPKEELHQVGRWPRLGFLPVTPTAMFDHLIAEKGPIAGLVRKLTPPGSYSFEVVVRLFFKSVPRLNIPDEYTAAFNEFISRVKPRVESLIQLDYGQAHGTRSPKLNPDDLLATAMMKAHDIYAANLVAAQPKKPDHLFNQTLVAVQNLFLDILKSYEKRQHIETASLIGEEVTKEDSLLQEKESTKEDN